MRKAVKSMAMAMLMIAGTPIVASATTIQLYEFFGYVPCTKGQIGCGQWPSPPRAWVRLSFANGLPAPECLQLQQQSVALTGAGFCNPPLR